MKNIGLLAFDGNNVVEVDISVIKKVEVIKAKEVVCTAALSDFSYTLLVLETLSSSTLLNYDEILAILYLDELVVFGKKIDVPSGWFLLDNIIKMGFAQKDYSFRDKDLYKLSEKGFKVVTDYLQLFNDKEKWINMNRKITMSDDSVVKSVITDYFK